MEGGAIGRGEINNSNDDEDDDEGGEERRREGRIYGEKARWIHKSPTQKEAGKIRIKLLPSAMLIMRVTTNQKKGLHFLFSTTYLSVRQCLK